MCVARLFKLLFLRVSFQEVASLMCDLAAKLNLADHVVFMGGEAVARSTVSGDIEVRVPSLYCCASLRLWRALDARWTSLHIFCVCVYSREGYDVACSECLCDGTGTLMCDCAPMPIVLLDHRSCL